MLGHAVTSKAHITAGKRLIDEKFVPQQFTQYHKTPSNQRGFPLHVENPAHDNNNGNNNFTHPTFALLLPLTSHHHQQQFMTNVTNLLISCRDTCKSSPLGIFVGVEAEDALLQSHVQDLVAQVHSILGTSTPCCIYQFNVSCHAMWRGLAYEATMHPGNFAYFMLGCGDDVVFKSIHWNEAVINAFKEQNRGLLEGFGIVALADMSFTMPPTLVVCGRIHMTCFAHQIVPTTVENQDGAPFLYYLYRAFGTATVLKRDEASFDRTRHDEAQYRKQHIPLWTFSPLRDSITHVKGFLQLIEGPIRAHPMIQPWLTMDVVIPSFRPPLPDFFTQLFSLRLPEQCAITFILISDNPAVADALEATAQAEANHLGRELRFRANAKNMGASFSRNRGLAESCADWVLFLDDDITMENDLLLVMYANAIRKYGDVACGFVGATRLPEPRTPRQEAVHWSCVTHFWRDVVRQYEWAPWGITANLCARRVDGVKYRTTLYPRTGGGEDVDFCVNTQRATGLPMRNLPEAEVCHPFWNDGACNLNRFYGWGCGDGVLIDVHPEDSFTNLPNFVEGSTLLMLMAFVHWLWTGTHGQVIMVIPIAMIVAEVLSLWWYIGNIYVAWQTFLVTSYTEWGRAAGHWYLGRGIRNIGLRWNFFRNVFPEAVWMDRKRCAALWVLRIIVLGLGIVVVS